MISALVFALALSAGDQTGCPMHEQHMKEAQGAAVDARHDTFGMSHDATHHNFRLLKDGGAIELRANDAKDQATVDVIRKHLHAVTASFAKNDFSTPMFVHGHTPDGVAEMKELQRNSRYRYEDVDGGGRIRMTATDPKALAAIHDFMKFQVTEHRTGDSGEVEK